MSSIHYVWWGNPQDPKLKLNASETPNMMVAAVHGVHDVHYWIGGTDAFDAPLDSRIIQHKFDPMTLLWGTPLQRTEAARLKKILDNLATFRAFAACKDIVSFAVMYRFGGFFFDTTTVIGEGYHELVKDDAGRWTPKDPSRRTNIARLLAGQEDIRAPYNPSGAGKVINVGDETDEYTMGYAMGLLPKSSNTKHVPNFDVWALYSPKKQHPAFARAVQTYIKRAENIGLDAPGAKKPMGGKRTVTEIMNNAEDKGPRNSIIAGLSTTSLLEAFYAYASQNGKTMQDVGWAFSHINKQVLDRANPTKGKPQLGDREILDQKWQAPKKEKSFLQKIFHRPSPRMPGMDANRIFGGMEAAALTIPPIGIQKRFAGSWR